MKRLVLTGSPHRQGTTALLADRYCDGARQAGHEVVRFDAGSMRIHPCSGCDACRPGGSCIYRDGMDDIRPHLLEAERVVLVSPLYYFGVTAQLKAVIDRFYASNAQLREHPKELELLAAGADTDDWAKSAVIVYAETIARYLGWTCRPPLVALGCATREALQQTDYPRQAGERGRV